MAGHPDVVNHGGVSCATRECVREVCRPYGMGTHAGGVHLSRLASSRDGQQRIWIGGAAKCVDCAPVFDCQTRRQGDGCAARMQAHDCGEGATRAAEAVNGVGVSECCAEEMADLPLVETFSI